MTETQACADRARCGNPARSFRCALAATENLHPLAQLEPLVPGWFRGSVANRRHYGFQTLVYLPQVPGNSWVGIKQIYSILLFATDPTFFRETGAWEPWRINGAAAA